MTLTKLLLLIAGIALAITIIRYFLQKPLSLPVALVQNFVGVFFIFSGFVKAIDPLGTAYKIDDYFLALNLFVFIPYETAFSVITIVLEIVLGIMLMLGYMRTVTVFLLLGMVLFFTFLTGYAVQHPQEISDCGCFGDFLKLKPMESFMKDIALSMLILFLVIRRKYIEPLFSNYISASITVVALVGFTLFCFRNFMWNEPIFDFRPYKVGNYLPDYMKDIAPKKVEKNFVYKEKTTGELRKLTQDELMKAYKEPGFTDKWAYDTIEEKVIDPGIPAKIPDFRIVDENGINIADSILSKDQYQFLVVSYKLEKASVDGFKRMNAIAEASEKEGFPFFAITSTNPKVVNQFRFDNQTAYPFLNTEDYIMPKTIMRSNPGLLLLKKGTVVGKWHHRQLPTWDELKRDYLK